MAWLCDGLGAERNMGPSSSAAKSSMRVITGQRVLSLSSHSEVELLQILQILPKVQSSISRNLTVFGKNHLQSQNLVNITRVTGSCDELDTQSGPRERFTNNFSSRGHGKIPANYLFRSQGNARDLKKQRTFTLVTSGMSTSSVELLPVHEQQWVNVESGRGRIPNEFPQIPASDSAGESNIHSLQENL